MSLADQQGSEDSASHLANAEACLDEALELNPELPLAHSVYARFDVDRGHAVDAMTRLIGRGLAGAREPELFAALVQACKFCGLLEAAVAAYEHARPHR